MRARRPFILIFISFFLESCREIYSPYSFVAFSTAFTNPEVEFFIQVWTRPLNFVCIFFFQRYRLMLWEWALFLRYFEAEHNQNSLCLHSLSWSILHQMIAVRGSTDVLNLDKPEAFQMPPPQSGGCGYDKPCGHLELAAITKGLCGNST